jgi:hypothetical protein
MTNSTPHDDSGAEFVPLEGEEPVPNKVVAPLEAPGQRTTPRPTRPLTDRQVPLPEPPHEGEIEVSWETAEHEPGFIERHERLLVVSMMFIGVLIRVLPILWGSVYFDAQQTVLHPDEPKLVRPLDDFPGSLSTYHDYRYPSLLPFAYGALWAPFSEVFDLRDPESSIPGSESYEAAQVFGRALNVLIFGLGGLLAIWAFTRRCFGAGPALLAVAAANVMGRPVTSTAMVSPDIPAAVLLFLIFYLLARAEGQPRFTVKAMLGVGFALGAAAATKYTSGIGALGVVLVLGHAWKRSQLEVREALRLLLVTAAAALTSFLMFVPGVLYDTQNFIGSLAYEFRSKLQLAQTDSSHLLRAIEANFPLWLVAVALLGVAVSSAMLREHSARKSFVLPAAGLSLAVYFLVSLQSFRADYAIPFFPFVAMFAGVGFWKVLQLPTRAVGLVAVSCLMLFGMLQSTHWCLQRYSGDTRYRIDAWITENLPPGPLGSAPSPTARNSGAKAPEGYQYIGVHGRPKFIVMFQRRAEKALEAIADPEDAHQRMVTYWGAERAAREFSWEPGKRRLGLLRERDLRFYEDVMLGMRRHFMYDLIKEFEPVDAPLDLPGRWCAVYARHDISSHFLEVEAGPQE